MSHYRIIGRAGAHVLLAGLDDEDIDNLLNTVTNQDPSIFLRTSLNPAALKQLIAEIRRDGYGVFKMPGRNWAGLSKSVLVNDKISLALSIRFHLSAVATDKAVKEFLSILNSGASELSENLSGQSFL